MLGTVTAIGNTEIQVDLGTKHAGYIPYDEVSADPTVKAEDILKVAMRSKFLSFASTIRRAPCSSARRSWTA